MSGLENIECIMRIFLLVFLASSAVRAQNVTASFRPFSFGENPAATATREFGIVSPQVSSTSSKELINVGSEGSVQSSWDRRINIHRYDFLAAGKGKLWVPEIYVSQNMAQLHLTPSEGTNKTENNINLVNVMGNLAYRRGNLNLGVSFFNNSVDYNQNGSFFDGTQTSTYSSTTKLKLTGGGLGTSVFLFSGFAVAAFYGKIFETQDFTTKTSSTTVDINPGGNLSLVHEKIGLGFSYQTGTSKGQGFRTEMSFFKMNFGGSENSIYGSSGEGETALKNVQARIVVEATRMGYTGGISLTRIYGRYINYQYLLDAIIAEFPFYHEPNDTIGGFFGFKSSTGSSFGGSVSYYNGPADTTLYSQKAVADTTNYGVGLSYAYAF